VSKPKKIGNLLAQAAKASRLPFVTGHSDAEPTAQSTAEPVAPYFKEGEWLRPECSARWSSIDWCADRIGGLHYCDSEIAGHDGSHRCRCGAVSTREWTQDDERMVSPGEIEMWRWTYAQLAAERAPLDARTTAEKFERVAVTLRRFVPGFEDLPRRAAEAGDYLFSVANQYVPEELDPPPPAIGIGDQLSPEVEPVVRELLAKIDRQNAEIEAARAENDRLRELLVAVAGET
jgi:hypothetical protein